MNFRTDEVLSKLVILAAVLMVFGIQWGQIDKGLSLWDEGFLWYGAQRTYLGEVPLRDFMSYDPARYYWIAGFMNLLGDSGIVPLRWSLATFQILGLCFLLIAFERTMGKRCAVVLALLALTVTFWMFPRHKLFDHSISIMLLGAIALVVSTPSRKRFFYLGLLVGLAAIFGRNHGVYGVFGSVFIMAWLVLHPRDRMETLERFALWTFGVVTGFLPFLLMIVFVPGLFDAFRDSVKFLLELKGTNLPLAVPWPWSVKLAITSQEEIFRQIIIGIFFVSVASFAVVGPVVSLVGRVRNWNFSPMFVSASALAIPYAHYAFSRADVGHLAHGIFPLLLGVFALLARSPSGVRWVGSTSLVLSSFLACYVYQPAWNCYTSPTCAWIAVGRDSVLVDGATAKDAAILHSLASKYASANRTFIAAPFWPGAYALLQRKAPVWEIYSLFPRSSSFEQMEIERIKAAQPGFAIIYDYALDGRNDLRYRNTHPIIFKYIEDNFDRLTSESDSGYLIYRTKARLTY